MDIMDSSISLEGSNNTDSTVDKEHVSNIQGARDTFPMNKTLLQKIETKMPLARIVMKASIAGLIAILFVFEDRCRNAVGPAFIFVPVGTFLYFPIKPINLQIESTLIGVCGVLLGTGWSALGIFLANLTRDITNPSPVQPYPSVVLSIFMIVGVFVSTYVRVKVTQATHGTIFCCVIIAFSLTQASYTPDLMPYSILTFLKSHLMAAAISFVVDIFLWPEDSITKYLGVLSKSLTAYNQFFEEQINGFVSMELPSKTLTLPSLHASLQASLLQVIDSKREVQREVLYSQLTQSDVQDLTRLFKQLSVPLHGIGLSVISKVERLRELDSPNFYTMANESEISDHKQAFLSGLYEMRHMTQELAATCISVLDTCNRRLLGFSEAPRSLTSTFLWPFPRVFSLSRRIPDCEGLLDQLDQMMAKHESRKASYIFIDPVPNQFEAQFNSLLQIIYLFRFNMKAYSQHVREFVALVERLHKTRTRKRLSLLPLQKWFRSQLDVSLITRQDRVHTHSRPYTRDPDVNPPETPSERTFLTLYTTIQWFTTMEAAFSLKTAIGFVLLSIPAFLPQSWEIFHAWRGQWATFTLVLWMFPMAGMFFYTVILRTIGTILGCVLGIVLWEMTRGNPYGLVILHFVVMVWLHYVFFTKPNVGMGVIMMQLSVILVISYEYQFKVSEEAVYDSVEVVAGKRMLLVTIGVGACAILSLIPKPLTGRVELRKRISKTLEHIGELYGILAADILTHADDLDPTPRQEKAFRKLALGIRRQISDERTYLDMSKMEPPLRGKFPIEVYAKLVDKVENMADLLQIMAYSSRSVHKAWKQNLVVVLNDERMEYVASILSIIKIVSSTMASKMALPPFMLSPKDLRNKLAEKLGLAIRNCSQRLDNETFPSYCTYAVSSHKFAIELEQVVECVEQLVGVEDPEHWLLLNA